MRSSYWFVPSLMALSAIACGAVAVWIDASFELTWLESLGWYQKVKAAGAREVLSTIAGSMITVAGVVFSVTIVALSYASSQYGPRVLTNFMDDRGNKVTLGTFIATFVYCLVVLRTIRGGDDDGFVPQFALLLGLGFALSSIAVLIYFIHHVPRAIHINHVVAGIGRQLIADIECRFPSRTGNRGSGVPDKPLGQQPWNEPIEAPCKVRGAALGYVQSIDEAAVIAFAEEHDLVIRLRQRPGDFVTRARTVIEAWPASRVDKALASDLARTFMIGSLRTPHSDLRFLVMELVEIAARALSPGVNDPVTAMTCIDWMAAALEEIASRDPPAAVRAGADGRTRVVVLPDDFATFIELSFGRLQGYAARDAIASVHVLAAIEKLSRSCRGPAQAAALALAAAELTELAQAQLTGPSRRTVVAHSARLVRELELAMMTSGQTDAVLTRD